MNKHKIGAPLVPALALAVIAAMVAQVGWAQHDDEESREECLQDDDDDETLFEEFEIYAELNDTDGDLGIHGLVDGDAWRYLRLEDPNERRLAKVFILGRLARQGLTEFFFESDEPSFDELSPDQFFRRFREGCYEGEGLTLDWEEIEGEAWFSHVMPAPPGNVMVSGVPASLDCEVNVPLVDAEEIVISWDPVTQHHPTIGEAGDIEVERYQVVVEFETEDEDGEELVYVHSSELPPDVTSISVPEAFLGLGNEFKYEIVVREADHNQTAFESCFVTELEDEEE